MWLLTSVSPETVWFPFALTCKGKSPNSFQVFPTSHNDNQNTSWFFVLHLGGCGYTLISTAPVQPWVSFPLQGYIAQCFSNFNRYLNPLITLLKCRLWFRRSGVDCAIHISYKLPGGADAAPLRTTLWVAMVSGDESVRTDCRGGMDQIIFGAFLCSSLPCNFKECFPKSDWESTALSYFYFHSVIESVASWLFLISNSLHLMALTQA